MKNLKSIILVLLFILFPFISYAVQVGGPGNNNAEDFSGGSIKDTKCINIDPDAATTDWFLWRTPVAITVTGIDCIVDAGTSVIMTPKECDANGANCVDIEAAITCVTTNTTEAGGSIDNPSVDAGDYIRVTRGVKTGAVTQAVLCMELTYD